MKRKLSTKTLIFLFLLVLTLVLPLVTASIEVKENVIFKTRSNNAKFVMGDDFTFYKAEINSTHLWLDKSYSFKHYTRYCISVSEGIIINSFPDSGYTYGLTENHPSATGNYSAMYQTFLTDADYKLTVVSFLLQKVGSPTGNANAVLYATTGVSGVNATPMGSALATSDNFDVSSLTTTLTWHNLTFSGASQYELQADTVYAIVFQNPSAGINYLTDYIVIGILDISSYSGNGGVYKNSDWSPYHTGELLAHDVNFRLFGEVLNSQFAINTWFATKDSSGKLTITSPLSANINMEFSSPNLLSASVSGAVSSSWDSGTKTLSFVVNSDTSSTFTISVSVTETEVTNTSPENYEVTVTDFEGCGNWVFTQHKYYTFQAKYWDGDGYEDLDTMKIAFTDGNTWVNASYDGTNWSLESGDDVVNLQDGTATVLDPNLLQVTFLIYFENTILDALDIDIYMYCKDCSGAEDDWEIKATDYFSIYNLGGHYSLETSGDAGRLEGGDIFDLYVTNNSWVIARTTFRNLQHVKMLPMIRLRNEGDQIGKFHITYFIDYCVDDVWYGWSVRITSINAYYGVVRYWNWTADWYEGNNLFKSEMFYIFFTTDEDSPGVGTNITAQLWADLWFNKENASSTFGGRLNSYYYPMEQDPQEWWEWLTGTVRWGVDETKRKQTMAFERMRKTDDTTIYAPQIQMVKLACKLEFDSSIYSQYAEVTEYDVFDLTLGNLPLEGIPTPPFDETIVPTMPQRGFLGIIFSALLWIAKAISDAFGPALLGFWAMLVGFLDTIFGFFGWPGGFSQILNWFTIFFAFVISSVTVAVQLLGSLYTILTSLISPLTELLLVTGYFITGIFQSITGMMTWLNAGYNDTVLPLTPAMVPILTLVGILLPVWELRRMEQHGFGILFADISIVIGVASFIINIAIQIVSFITKLLSDLVEKIPIVE